MSDGFDRLVALRPEVPDETGWADSPAGREVLARVHAAGAGRRRWWTRRRFVVPTVLIGIGAAVGGGVAFAPASRTPVVQDVGCLDRTSDGFESYSFSGLQRRTPHAEIVARCNAERKGAGHAPATDFALCVVPPGRNQVGGSILAIPSDVVVTSANAAAVCQAARYEPLR